MYTLPSPSATPRESQPQQTTLIFGSRFARYSQRIFSGRDVDGEGVVLTRRHVDHPVVDERLRLR
jgi:hypothetical protein